MKIIDLFNDFDKINYAYLRDYNYLKTIPSNDDVDILIKREDVKQLTQILFSHGYITLEKYKSNSRDMFFYHISKNQPSINFHIDKLVKFPFFDVEIALSRLKMDRNIKVFSEEDKLLVLLFKDYFIPGIFGFKRISNSKSKEIIMLLKNEKAKKTLRNFLRRYFIQSSQLYNQIMEEKYNFLSRRILQLKFLFKNINHINYYLDNLKHILLSKQPFKKNLSITFSGVDGSGKTTAVDYLQSILSSQKKSYSTLYLGRWGHHIIPLQKMEGKIIKKRKITLETVKPTIFQKTIRDFYYMIEYVLRYFIRILPAKLTNAYLLTDRYVYDLLFVQNPLKITKLFVYLYPKSTINIILYHNINEIYIRKKELTIAELKKQQKILLGLKNTITIETKSITKTQQKLLHLILKQKNEELYSFLK